MKSWDLRRGRLSGPEAHGEGRIPCMTPLLSEPGRPEKPASRPVAPPWASRLVTAAAVTGTGATAVICAAGLVRRWRS